VRILRQILAQDQKTFAAAVGISLSALRRIEQNTGGVRLDTLGKILNKYSLELRVKAKK